MSVVKKIVVVALFAAGVAPVLASPISVTQGLNLGAVYGTETGSQRYDSAFDAAAALGTSHFAAAYSVNAASLHFSWQDDLDNYALSSSSSSPTQYGSYVYSGYNGNYVYRRTARTSGYQTYTRADESANIDLSGVVRNAAAYSTFSSLQTSTSSYSTYDGGRSGYTYTYGCGFWGWSTCGGWVPGEEYHTDYHYTGYTYYNDNTGDFSLDIDLLALGGSALADLLDDGRLSFGMTMFGDARLSSASLLLDVSQRNNVPEPSMLALLGIGLAGFGALRAKRKA